jgi:hypothetical protein
MLRMIATVMVKSAMAIWKVIVNRFNATQRFGQ